MPTPTRATAATVPAAPDLPEGLRLGAERLMARTAVRVGAVLAVAATVPAAFLRGAAGAFTALGAVLLVAGGFALSALVQAWGAKQGPSVLQGVTFASFFGRLLTYAILIAVLEPLDVVDGPVLAITATVAVITLLTIEVRLVLRHTELWWVDATATTGKDPA